jgi:hypothetical protein
MVGTNLLPQSGADLKPIEPLAASTTEELFALVGPV